MHLAPVFVTTTRYNSKSRKSKSVKAVAATAKHDAWLRERGLHPEQRKLQQAFKGQHQNDIPDYTDTRHNYELSNSLHVGGGFKKGVMANLHKESPEVQKAIMEKAARTTMAYNKGPTMYFSPESDTTNLGSKSRRG